MWYYDILTRLIGLGFEKVDFENHEIFDAVVVKNDLRIGFTTCGRYYAKYQGKPCSWHDKSTITGIEFEFWLGETYEIVKERISTDSFLHQVGEALWWCNVGHYGHNDVNL